MAAKHIQCQAFRYPVLCFKKKPDAPVKTEHADMRQTVQMRAQQLAKPGRLHGIAIFARRETQIYGSICNAQLQPLFSASIPQVNDEQVSAWLVNFFNQGAAQSGMQLRRQGLYEEVIKVHDILIYIYYRLHIF